jgi:hypothetical protein
VSFNGTIMKSFACSRFSSFQTLLKKLASGTLELAKKAKLE